jgi:hypothetical protein
MTLTTTSKKFTSKEPALTVSKSSAVFLRSGKAELVFLLSMEKILKEERMKIKEWTKNGPNTGLEKLQAF